MDNPSAAIVWKPGPACEPPDFNAEAGDCLLVLVAVRDRLQGGRVYWEPQVIVATEDGWNTPDGESWSAWDVDDVSWWVKLDRFVLPPLPVETERKAR